MRLVFMDKGRIAEQGPVGDVLANPRTPELAAFLDAVLH